MCSSTPCLDSRHSLLKSSPFPDLPFNASDPSFSYVSVFLDPVTVTAEGPSYVSAQGEACIPQMTPTVSLSTPTDAHTRPEEAIPVVPPTPYCSLTYGRYYIAYQVEEPSGSTIKAMHLWGTYSNTTTSFKRYWGCNKQVFSLSINLLINFSINQIIVWSIKHSKIMKRHNFS